MSNGRYRITIDDRAYDVTVNPDAGTVSVDGVSLEARVTGSGRAAHVVVDGHSLPAVVTESTNGTLHFRVRGAEIRAIVQSDRDLLLERFGVSSNADIADLRITAPMPGLVLRLEVEDGSEVQKGDALVVLEAMKMENELAAPTTGRVQAIHVSEGEAVAKGALLVEIHPE